MKTFVKTPDAELDYIFDWAPLSNGRGASDWLEAGETISSYTITPDSGITIEDDELVDLNTAVLIWVSGGVAGEKYNISCEIMTNSTPARIDTRTLVIICRRK